MAFRYPRHCGKLFRTWHPSAQKLYDAHVLARSDQVRVHKIRLARSNGEAAGLEPTVQSGTVRLGVTTWVTISDYIIYHYMSQYVTMLAGSLVLSIYTLMITDATGQVLEA